MFKREMKINLKSFIIWASILVALFLVVFLIYPSLVNSGNMQSLDDVLAVFPEELLKAFNMDISSLNSVYGWLKSEGFIFVLLIVGIYSGILGSNILLKEENDKTIEYLHSLPVTRTKIVLSKILCGLIYIVLLVLIVGVFNYIGLELSGDFDRKQYILLSITPLLPALATFSICLFLSTFTHKSKKTLFLSIGIVFISYFLQIISELSEDTEIIKYASLFTLADVRNVITDVAINPIMIVISIGLFIIFSILTLVRYNKKELV